MFEAVANEADEDEEEAQETSATDGAESADDDGGEASPSISDDRRRWREERERARDERAAERETARAERRSARLGSSRRTSAAAEDVDGGDEEGAAPATERGGRPPSPSEAPRSRDTGSLSRWLSGVLRSPPPRSSDAAGDALSSPSSGLDAPLLGSTDDSGSSDNDDGNIV